MTDGGLFDDSLGEGFEIGVVIFSPQFLKRILLNTISSNFIFIVNNSIIQIQDLQFNWDKSKVPFIIIPKLALLKSEHLWIKGESGSGKTTFLNLLSGVSPLSSGKIKIYGGNLADVSSSKWDTIEKMKLKMKDGKVYKNTL
ncbi:ATP-binding cassette domain-containing protein [Algoriphagus namhaensis]|uniref:ATP-binding cassette domain-containing protein n=1 Tax=Algoriphagus namhaensis TaxID=915353 RepID=A0ABV8AM62_9BACT